MEPHSLNMVNEHYLQSVMKLAKDNEITASEDIYNTHGMKLVGKGRHIDDNLYDRLIRFKLRRPLECSLVIRDSVSARQLIDEARTLLDEVQPLSALLRAPGSTGKALTVLRDTRLDQVGTLFITMEKGLGNLPHSVLTSLFALAIGIGLQIEENMLRKLVLASLMHDAGELYINRDYLKPDRELMPEEWKHLAVHPHIGQMVIQSMTEYSGAVAMAIAEHHERENGFGYPRQLTGDSLSTLGKILLISEALSGIFTKEKWSLPRLCLAVRLIPGEYSREIVSFIASVPREHMESAAPESSSSAAEISERIGNLEQAICSAIDEMEKHLDKSAASTTPQKQFLDHIHRRLLTLRSALYATVFTPCADLLDSAEEASELMIEAQSVAYEIEWRMREVSRQISLRSTSLGPDAIGCMLRVASLLN